MKSNRSLKGRLKRHRRGSPPKQAEPLEEQKRQERRVARQAEVKRTIKVLEGLERRRQEAERLRLEPEPEPQPTGPRKNWSKMKEQELKKKIEELRNIENNINDILNKINTTIQGCIKKGTKEDDCLELQELKEKHKKYTSNKEEIVESIRLTYDEYNES